MKPHGLRWVALSFLIPPMLIGLNFSSPLTQLDTPLG
jgi:hypothetical protein